MSLKSVFFIILHNKHLNIPPLGLKNYFVLTEAKAFLEAKAPLGLASVTGHGSRVNPKKFQIVITCIHTFHLARYFL